MVSHLVLVHSFLCCIFGYSAFVAFLVLQNYPSSVLALISGITDSASFFLNILAYKETLHHWFSTKGLKRFSYSGIIVAVAASTSFMSYVSLEIYRKRPILPIPPSYVLPIIWSIIAIRAGCLLMYHSIKYQRALDTEPLINEEPHDDTLAGTQIVNSDNVE